MVRGRLQTRRFVRFGDRVQSPLKAAHLRRSGALGDLGGDGLRNRWESGKPARFAPPGEVAPV